MEEKRRASAIGQASSRPAAFQITAAGANAAKTSVTGDRFSDRLWHGRWMLLWTSVAFALVALMLGALRPPLYKVQTSIEVRSPDRGPAAIRGDGADLPDSSETYLQTQIRIIESRTLAERVLSRLTDAERARLVATPHFWWARSTYDQSIDDIRSHIVAKQSAHAGIIDISLLSPDSEAGAHFLNILNQELADSNIERAWRSVQRNRQWAERQIDELRRKWEQSEQAAAEYAQQAGIVETKAEGTGQQTASPFPVSNLAQAEANDGKLRAAQARLAGLRKQIAQWQALYGSNGTNMQNLQRAAGAEEAMIRQRRATLRANAAKQAAGAPAIVVGSAPAQTTAANGASVHLAALRQEAEANRALYEASALKLKEASVATVSQSGDINVVDPAIPVNQTATPSQWITGLAGALLGFAVAIVYIAFRDRFSQTFSNPALVIRDLGLPLLGTIPVDRFGERERNYNPVTQEPGLQLNFETNVRMAEAFRAIRSSILLDANEESAIRRIVFTSPGKLEGKTFVVANLGAALASAQRRVLLVDGNLRHPSLHKIFGGENEHGLADLLSRQIPAEPITSRDVIRETQVPDLYLLSAGQAGINAPEMLSSAQLPPLIREFAKGFDYVLLDSPPILPYSDTRSLARSADAVVLIVKAGSTNRQSAIQARDAISQDGATILGSILTEWDGLASPAAY